MCVVLEQVFGGLSMIKDFPKIDRVLSVMGRNPSGIVPKVLVSIDRGALILQHDRPSHTLLHVTSPPPRHDEEEPFMVAVPEFRRALADHLCDIEVHETSLVMQSARTSRVVDLIEEDPFLMDDPPDTPFVWGGDLAPLLEYLVRASHDGDYRPHLASVLFTQGSGVTTDGHRLHTVDLPFTLEKAMLVSSEGVKALLNVLKASKGPTTSYFYQDSLRVVSGPWMTIIPALHDVRFPPYEKVIPSDAPFLGEPPYGELVSAMKSAKKSLEKDALIYLEWKGYVLILSSLDGTFSATVPVMTYTDGLKALYNLRYLFEALQPGARFYSHGHQDALKITHDFGLSVVMPVRP